jgi:hypothetical protein
MDCVHPTWASSRPGSPEKAGPRQRQGNGPFSEGVSVHPARCSSREFGNVVYQARHAGVEVQLAEGGAAVQPDRLARGEVHLAIMPAGDERLDGRLLFVRMARSYAGAWQLFHASRTRRPILRKSFDDLTMDSSI